jgi:hypothetical protein
MRATVFPDGRAGVITCDRGLGRYSARRRRPAQAGCEPRETILELDFGLPPEYLARARNVRLAYLRIVHRQRLEDDFAR